MREGFLEATRRWRIGEDSNVSMNELVGSVAFQRAFGGDVVTASSPDYDSARKLWNGDIDRKPIAVVKATSDADVAMAIRFARDAGVPLGVRGGGHSYPGHSMVEGGLVIDLSRMGAVTPDPDNMRVTIGGGALLGSVDQALTPLGHVMPAGVVSHTGMPGLALGGGVGYLSRSFGLTCDQFVRLRVVTAEGEVVYASADENSDLFWALRGGGGNFGVVTEFKCRTHILGPVQAGALVYRMSDAPDICLAMNEVLQAGPRELMLAFSQGYDPEKFGLQGERLLVVYVVYRGNPEDSILAQVRGVHPALVDTVAPTDWITQQTMHDQAAKPGIGWYMKSGYTRTLSRELLELIARDSVDYRSNVSSPAVGREVYTLQSLGGAIQDVDDEDSAYSGREALWHGAIEAGFTSQEERDRILPWVRDAFSRTRELMDMTTSYVNLNFEQGTGGADPLLEVFGAEKYARLRRIKTQWDPQNLFRHNFNIKPLESGSV